jgi:hypothetical protein
MPGIEKLTVEEFQARINRFDQQYVRDWTTWLNTQPDARATQLGLVLRRWQACRPNTMRRTKAEKQHSPPYLDDLIAQAAQHLQQLQHFDIRIGASFAPQNCDSLIEVWNVFQNLSYHGRVRNGLAGVVGISKAVLLLTDGRVGPAFDSEVRRNLQLGSIDNPRQWIDALKTVCRDIRAFERNNQISLQDAAPRHYGGLHSGRLYDMALGPG